MSGNPHPRAAGTTVRAREKRLPRAGRAGREVVLYLVPYPGPACRPRKVRVESGETKVPGDAAAPAITVAATRCQAGSSVPGRTHGKTWLAGATAAGNSEDTPGLQ